MTHDPLQYGDATLKGTNSNHSFSLPGFSVFAPENEILLPERLFNLSEKATDCSVALATLPLESLSEVSWVKLMDQQVNKRLAVSRERKEGY